MKAKAHGSRPRGRPRVLRPEPALPLEAAEGSLTLCLSLVGRIDGKVFQLGGYQHLSEKQRRLLDEVSAAAKRTVADLDHLSRELGLTPLKDFE